MGASNDGLRKTWIMNLINLEKQRLFSQVELDSEKTQLERNKLGQFATPPKLASEIINTALSYQTNSHIKFLEPSVGSGAFFSALLEKSNIELKKAVGIEIDGRFANLARKLWSNFGLEIIEGDFTEKKREIKEKFNLLISNPPYVRHHHIPGVKKQILQDKILQELGIKLSGLSGLYIYFILLADKWIEEDGLSAWLIPTEWMDVNYGEALRHYLLKKVELIRVHRFNSEDVQFDDALVSSSVVFFKKKNPSSDNNACAFTEGSSIEKPSKKKFIKIEDLEQSKKWSKFFTPNILKDSNDSEKIKIGDIFNIKRGIATGANDYFIKELKEFKKLAIPDSFLKPVIPSIKQLKGITELSSDSDGYPLIEKKFAMFDSFESEEVLKNKYPKVYDYLNSGTARDVQKSYLVSRRSPWYRQEQRPHTDIFVTYMGRPTSKRPPFRFIFNTSKAVATNTYLLLSIKNEHKGTMTKEILNLLVNYLNSNEIDLLGYGRLYGGGLCKLEPSELADIDVSCVLKGKIIKTHQYKINFTTPSSNLIDKAHKMELAVE